jgi:phage-related tail protein
MSLSKCITHNEGIFTSLFIALILLLAMLSCHLTETQKNQAVSTAAETAIAVSTGQPIPWKTIGLFLGNILGTGAIIDNRRKDVLIKILKRTSNASKTLADQIRDQASVDSTEPR